MPSFDDGLHDLRRRRRRHRLAPPRGGAVVDRHRHRVRLTSSTHHRTRRSTVMKLGVYTAILHDKPLAEALEVIAASA